MKPRIKELDGLRGVAAISVVLFHYFTRYDQIYNHENITSNLFSYGHYGVNLFFIISGFVIFWSLQNIQNPLDFVVSRFARLYPVYWAAVVLTFLSISLFGLPGRESSIPTFCGNLLMFHDYFDIPHVDGVYWTLNVELTFYVWMFIIFSLNLIKRIDFISLFALSISTLFHVKIIPLHNPLIDLLFVNYVAFFIIGISLYKMYIKNTTVLTFANFVFAHLLIYLIFGLEPLIICSSITLLVYLGITRNLLLLKNPILIFLGTVSYSLYLIHQNIGYIIIRKGYQYELHPLISIILSMLLTIAISFALHRFIEKPIGKAIKNTYKKHKASGT